MTTARLAVADFQLANPIYIGARVTFWAIDGSGAKTAVAATLYADATGATTAANPQTLDGEGKLRAPVYLTEPAIATVTGRNVSSHDTGIIGTVFLSGYSLPGGTAGQAPVMGSGGAAAWRNFSGAFTVNEFGVATLAALSAGNLTNGTVGSGAVVLEDSPSLTTPDLGVATATSINGVTFTPGTGTLTLADGKTLEVRNTLAFEGTDGRAYRFPADNGDVLTADSTAALTNKTIDSAGAGNVIKVSGVAVSRGQFPASNTNDAATAGNIGQHASSSIAGGSAVALVSGAAKTITSIPLPAGDWDVRIDAVFTVSGGATNVVFNAVSISQVNNTHDLSPGLFAQQSNAAAGVVVSGANTLAVPSVRVSLAAAATIYFVASSSFTVAANSVWGLISARRAR